MVANNRHQHILVSRLNLLEKNLFEVENPFCIGLFPTNWGHTTDAMQIVSKTFLKVY